MITPIHVPKLGMHMMEAEVTAWLAADRSFCEKGEPVVTVETDKVEHEIEAPAAGFLRIMATPGEIRPIGDVIGVIAETEAELP